jgi:hypothetical protein
MSDQTLYPQIQTLGPADPKAPAIQKSYTVVSALLGLVAVAGTFGMITAEQAASLGAVGTTGAAFIGAAATAVASFRTKKQLNNGTFTEAPVLPAVPALEQIKILRDVASQELSRGEAAVKASTDVITGVLGNLPVVGGAAAGAVNAGAQAAEDLLGRFTFR